MTNLYFAYGSNMDKHRFLDRVGTFRSERAAVLRNHELCFNKLASGPVVGKGYANIKPSPSSVVEGILYEIDEVGLRKLDRKESHPYDYERFERAVEIRATGEVRLAHVYIANTKKLRDRLYPSEEYLGYLRAGERFLTSAYLEFLASVPTLESLRTDKQSARGSA